MKQAQAGEHERAAANATLLAVMRRMASPLRHDLAGALLIPSLRLQMLRRQLGAATLARERLQAMVDEVIAANPAQVEKARANPKLAGWFVGQVMKATGGKANPATVNALVAQKLGL